MLGSTQITRYWEVMPPVCRSMDVMLTDRSRADSMVERDPTNNDTLHTPEECETIGVRLTSADDLNDHAPLISVG